LLLDQLILFGKFALALQQVFFTVVDLENGRGQ